MIGRLGLLVVALAIGLNTSCGVLDERTMASSVKFDSSEGDRIDEGDFIPLDSLQTDNEPEEEKKYHDNPHLNDCLSYWATLYNKIPGNDPFTLVDSGFKKGKSFWELHHDRPDTLELALVFVPDHIKKKVKLKLLKKGTFYCIVIPKAVASNIALYIGSETYVAQSRYIDSI